MLFRYMVKKVARMHGLYATFMPKPINGQNGSGMHVHQSLWKGGKNVFFDPKSPIHLSETAVRYVAGLMVHARETSAVFSQWMNSYKRLIEGYEAPVYIAWGQKNRSAYIRVPEYQPGKEHATRIELRCPDPGCNIYLSPGRHAHRGAGGNQREVRSAGRRRREHLRDEQLPPEEARYPDPPPQPRGSRPDHGEERAHEGRSRRPHLREFLANKRREIEEYDNNVSGEFDKQVSDYEVRKYLPIL